MKKLLIILIFFESLYCEIFSPIPNRVIVDQKKVNLGKKLFNDPILSKDNSISCATCHPLEKYGVDGLEKSFGINGQKGLRNTPSIYNSTFNFRQMWDGKTKTLEEQALLPLTSKNEMGESVENIVKKLEKNSFYSKEFKSIYNSQIKIENLLEVLAAFQKQLLTPDSKFDLYLKGNEEILTKEEKKGFELFKSKGCASCHNGVNIGGNNFQKFGYFIPPKHLDDLGRFLVTNKEDDKYVFKVPSLRNIEKTAPYLHDGKAKTLKEAVKIISLAQVGIVLKDEEIESIIAFLKTLTGKLPHENK